MTALNMAFTATTVSLDKSLGEIDRLLVAHGVTENRYTHMKPRDPNADGEDGQGRIVYEFLYPIDGDPFNRAGVRVAVIYQPVIERPNHRNRLRTPKGTTPQQAARALYWYLKAKFDAIDWGIEEFRVAFMPHLVTQLGTTFAEEPWLIDAAVSSPGSIAELTSVPDRRLLAAPVEARVIDDRS